MDLHCKFFGLEMRLSTAFKLSSSIIIVSFFLVSLTVFKMNQAEKIRLLAIDNQSKLEVLGRQLARGSDYLTSEIRRYVQFGDERHFNNFWREVNETKTREVIEDLVKLNTLPNEIKFIEKSKYYSDNLIKTEEQAMVAVKEGNLDKARKLVFGNYYDQQKDLIMGNIKKFQNAIHLRTQNEVDAANEKIAFYLFATNILLVVSAVLVLVLQIGFTRKRILNPLKQLRSELKNITDDSPDLNIKFSTKDELHELTESFKELMDQKLEFKKTLETSQRFLSNLISNLNGMVYHCKNDKNRTMDFVSIGSIELTGYKPEQIQINNYISFNEIIHPEDREEIWNTVQEALKKKAPFILTYKIITLSGELKYVRDQGHGVWLDNGELEGLQGFITDISEEVRKSRELERSEQKFKSYFQMPLSGVAIFDTEGRWIELNDRMCEIVGYSREELMGFVWTEVTHPEDIEPCMNLIEEIKNKKRDQYRVEKKYVGRDAKITYVEAYVGCIRNEQGEPEYYVALVQDISLRKKQETELNRYRNRLEDLVAERNADLIKTNDELEKFTYTASHDLIEPLRKVFTFGDMLKEACMSKLSDKEVGYIGKMQKAAFRMKVLIDDLLWFSQFREKGASFEQLDLNILIQEVLEDLEVQIKETQGDIQIYDLPEIEADKIQMRQLFQNLISNGLKYQRRDVPPKIIIKSNPVVNGCHEITIEDNGIGFEEQYAKKIFEPFQRLNRESDTQGSGMGLFICNKIMRRHNGALTVKSKPGEGTTFFISLPQKQSHYH